MAKDLNSDSDLTLRTGPEALGTAAEYTPPSRYNFVAEGPAARCCGVSGGGPATPRAEDS